MKGQFGDFVRAMCEAHLENIECLKKSYANTGMEWVVYAPGSMKGTQNAQQTPNDKLIVSLDTFAGQKTKYIDLANVITINLNNNKFNRHCVSTSFKA